MAPLIVMTTLLALIAACIATPLSHEGQTLKWQKCPATLGYLQHTIECAEVQVPLDYSNPTGGENITIGILRLPALKPKKRIGNLFFNPGGPGDSATSEINSTALSTTAWHEEIRERFDLIGVDLRGTALSTPILFDQETFVKRVNLLPENTQDFKALVAKNIALRESSIKMTGLPLINFMDTSSIARDHEIVRSALGDEKLNWLGLSGGTYLGTRYAELFPNNIRAMVIDAVVAQSQVGVPAFIENAVSDDATMKQFFQWCAQQNSITCPLGHVNGSAEATWTSVVARAEQSPLPAPGCTPKTCVYSDVTADELRKFVLNFLYKPYLAGQGFAALAAGLHDLAIRNDATGIAENVYAVPDKSSPAFTTASMYATNVIECNDRINDDTWVSMREKSIEGETSFPLIGGRSVEAVFESACAGWPSLGRNPPHTVDINYDNTTMPTVLIVSNLYDPATPYSWGTKVQQEIGDEHVRRITRNASGHTSYFQPDAFDGKTVAAVNEYLVSLRLPKQDVVFDN